MVKMTNVRARHGRNGFATRAALWSARHRLLAIAGWLVIVAAVTVLSGQIGTIEAGETDGLHGESGRAELIIAEAGFPERHGEMVLVQSATGTVEDPLFVAAVNDVTAALSRTGVVVDLAEPVPSVDRRSMLVQFALVNPDDVDKTLDAVGSVRKAHPDLYIRQTGSASVDKAIGDELEGQLGRLSMLSLPLTLGILLVAFGALVAALLPVVLAITALIAALGLLAVVSRAFPTVDTTMHVMLLIGLAVGVDYCLFYIRREREERARGADAERALTIAAQTSGRSIWISGVTVFTAMAGLLFTRDVDFMSFATGTMLVVATAVIGSLTALPAMLSLLGDRVNAGRLRFWRRRTTNAHASGAARQGGRAWPAILAVVLRWPLISGVLAAVAMGALAAPALHLRTQPESVDDFLSVSPIMETWKEVQLTYPGGPAPAQVVVKANDVRGADVTAAVQRFRLAAVATGVLHEPISVQVNPRGDVAIVSVGLSGSGSDSVSDHALSTLREKVIPGTLGAVAGAEVAVTGDTARTLDFTNNLEGSLPTVVAFVVLLAFMLMLVSFRSVVVATTTILLNVLSVAAAYGLLVLLFQDGLGEHVGLTTSGGLTTWIPLFLFVILFGLSMDYHVFVVSRIREGYDRGLGTRQAVLEGVSRTAGVISSAAVVMVAVFSLFATLPIASMQQFGIGLAAAVLLDATIVRAVLLPAIMALLGERNWYVPRWLSWLPTVDHDVSYTEPSGPGPLSPLPAMADTDQRRIRVGASAN